MTLSGVLAALLLSATGAQAQPSATAQSPTVADPTSEQIKSWIAGNHGEVDDDAQAAGGQKLRDGRIHGEVGASIGSGGYKSAYGVATAPIGPNSDLTVGLAGEHLGDGNRTGWNGRNRGGDRRSLFIGLNLNGAGERNNGCDALQPRPWNGALEPLAPASERCPAVEPPPGTPPR